MKEADDPALSVRRGNGMRAEQSEWIGMPPREQSVNLSVQVRVALRFLCWRKDARKRRGRWLFFFRHEALLRGGV
jgi:hypothetical protein